MSQTKRLSSVERGILIRQKVAAYIRQGGKMPVDLYLGKQRAQHWKNWTRKAKNK